MNVTARPPVVVGVRDKQPRVLVLAAAEARRRGVGLRVVHCYTVPAQAAEFFLGADPLETARIAAQSVLVDARAVLAGTEPPVDVDYVLAHGRAEAVLLEHSHDADSLVLGADDVPWFDRMLGGAVAGHLARRAACPVVVVPEVEVDLVGPEDGPVVVTIDGDTSAAGPLRYAFAVADASRRELRVLHAAPAGTLQDDFDNHRANVAEVVAGWRDEYPDVPVEVCTTSADPLDTCLAATSDASLLVIGRPRGDETPFALARPLAVQVLRAARCSVAVMPSDLVRS